MTTTAESYARPEGVAQASKWHGSGWCSCGRTGGQFAAGSVDFPIVRGDTLWLDSE